MRQQPPALKELILWSRDNLYKPLTAQGASAGPLATRLVGGNMATGWVVRNVLRWESRLSRIQMFGEGRALQKGEHLLRAGRQLRKWSVKRCPPGLGFQGAWVRSEDVSPPCAPASCQELSKNKMPEPNPQRFPVLWSGSGERTFIRAEKKKVMAHICLNCFPSTRNHS